MAKNIQKISKKDKYRMLVTETIPYETPLIFSNDGFYKFCKEIESHSIIEKQIFDYTINSNENKGGTIPYKYFIKKNQLEFRQLSLVHPAAQYEMYLFYKKYEKLICYYCTKSSFSIRSPLRVASTFYFKNSWENIRQYKRDSITNINTDIETKHSSSYFSYKGHDRLYKFFNSNDFLGLEKKFNSLVTLDVSKCFDSIYTHSIAWATKEKQFTKDNVQIKSTFGSQFDTIMQRANHNETNGILIGPEISRIFAEIILQDIDLGVLRKLEERGLISEYDYAIRRYVDDVFIFAKSENTAKSIYLIFTQKLAEYNLRTNSSKSSHYTHPFFTQKSKVIRELNDEVNTFIEKFLEPSPDNTSLIPKKIHRKNKLLRSFIDSIKGICHANNVNYDAVSSYLISAFFERTKKLINITNKDSTSKCPEDYRDSIQVLLELLFFFYSVSPSVSSSYNLCSSIILVSRFSEKYLVDYDSTIKQYIFELTVQLLSADKSEYPKEIKDFLFLERINIVLAISDFGDEYLLDEKIISSLIQDDSGYFQIMTTLYYIKNRVNFLKIKESLIKLISKKISNIKNVSQNSELIHIILDSLVCPYIDIGIREEWLKNLYSAMQRRINENDGINFLLNNKKRYFFINWQEIDLLNLLEKKELRRVY